MIQSIATVVTSVLHLRALPSTRYLIRQMPGAKAKRLRQYIEKTCDEMCDLADDQGVSLFVDMSDSERRKRMTPPALARFDVLNDAYERFSERLFVLPASA